MTDPDPTVPEPIDAAGLLEADNPCAKMPGTEVAFHLRAYHKHKIEEIGWRDRGLFMRAAELLAAAEGMAEGLEAIATHGKGVQGIATARIVAANALEAYRAATSGAG